MIRVLLEPTFDWGGNGLWREFCSALKLSDSVRIIRVPKPARTKISFRKFGADIVKSRHNAAESHELSRIRVLTKHPDFKQFEKVFSALMRREDNYGELRDVDVEVFRFGLLDHFSSILKSSGADLVLFPVSPHTVETYSLFFAAKAMGIKTLWFQPCSMAPTMLPREDFDKAVKIAYFSSGSGDRQQEIILDILTESLSRAESLQSPRYMQRQALMSGAASSFLGRTRALRMSFKWLIHERYDSRFAENHGGFGQKAIRRFLQVYKPRLVARMLRDSAIRFSSSRKLQGPYALFALHYEPERTSVPEGGEDASQLQQVISACSVLPSGVTMCVKEHASQLSPALQGHKGRSPYFYELLVSRFGLRLDVETPMKDLLRSAFVVFTGTGNVGVEAALNGVPVVYFGNPWWEGMPGAIPFSEVERKGITDCGLNPADSRDVKDFLLSRISEMVAGGASESADQLTARFGVVLDDFSATAGNRLAEAVEAYCVNAFPADENSQLLNYNLE